MPPKKKQKTCVCGTTFVTPASYANHTSLCMAHHRQLSTRLLRFEAKATAASQQPHTPASNGDQTIKTNNPNPGATQPDVNRYISIAQQKHNITCHRPTMKANLMKEQHEGHTAEYAANLCSMKPHVKPNVPLGDIPNKKEDTGDEYDEDVNVGTFGDDVEVSDGDEYCFTNDVDDVDDDNEDDDQTDKDGNNEDQEPLFPLIAKQDNRNSKENNIKFQGRVAPSAAAAITLMNVLEKRSVDLSLYDDLVKCIYELAQDFDFKQPLPNRAQLTSTCEKTFNYKQLEPKMIDVRVATMSTPTVTVPVFDIQALLQKMLRNPTLMTEDNIAKNLDIFTGDVTETEFSTYDEIHTGQRWKRAVQHYCTGENDFPCGMIVFYDKSHCDRHGSLSVSPLLFTLSLFNKESRAKSIFWDVLAYIPNLEYRTTKSSDSSIAQATTAELKCQDEHNCLFAVLRQLREVNESGGIPMRVMGRDVNIKCWIHIVVGDISGNNNLLGSYNNPNVSSPYRDCSCSIEDILNPEAPCNFILKADIDRMKDTNNTAALKAASKHNITNAFDTIPTGDPVNGIYWSTPPETMHAIQSGIVPRMLSALPKNFKRKENATILHNMHLLLIDKHYAQSERDQPRGAQRSHILETTKTQASEMMGNIFLFMCTLHTKIGINVCLKAGVSEADRKGMITTIKMILSLEKWFNRRNRKSDVDDCSMINTFVRRKLIPNLQQYFPRQEGMGWKFPKVHSLTKFATFIQAFGSGINFFGGIGESMLKEFMKHLAANTQRRPNIFASQLGKNHYRRRLFEHSSRCIDIQRKMNYKLVQNELQQDCPFKGRHKIAFTRKQSNATLIKNVQYHHDVKWQSSKVRNREADLTMIYTICNYMAKYESLSHFHIDAYTSAKLPNSEESLEDYNTISTHSIYRVDTNTGRNDWCMIQTHKLGSEDEDENMDTWDYLCPARIHGFFKFDTCGTPTPQLMRKYNNDADMIMSLEKTDDTMYVVVRTPENFLTWNMLEREFVLPIQLGGLEEYTYIFPVSRIVNPLYVFKDHGSTSATEDDVSFFASLPSRYWPFYIDHLLHPNEGQGARGFSQKSDEYTD